MECFLCSAKSHEVKLWCTWTKCSNLMRPFAGWSKRVEQIYAAIPDFGGFVLKADSEDRPGPSFYGRTQADAANVIARPLKSHGGVLFYRAFVYNHHLDWHDLNNDRAKAAYDY